jgi:Uma2 family endonuclease
MNALAQPQTTKPEPRQRFVLWNLGWDSYEKIVEALAETHVRTTYYRGDLELVSPLPSHEAVKVWFRYFMLVLGMELDLPFRGMGSTTLHRRDRDCGLDPDDCYYLSSISKVVDWLTLNMNRDPPPDLVLEVDITRSSLNRLDVYAGLGVPEVWRYDGDEWHIHLLGEDEAHRESPSSAAFPYLPIAEIMPLMRQSLHVGDDRALCRRVREWLRERVLPLRQTWEQQHPPAG